MLEIKINKIFNPSHQINHHFSNFYSKIFFPPAQNVALQARDDGGPLDECADDAHGEVESDGGAEVEAEVDVDEYESQSRIPPAGVAVPLRRASCALSRCREGTPRGCDRDAADRGALRRRPELK